MCLSSDSEILVPSLGKPALSSSRVIVPLLSVSIDLNSSFKPIISSSDKFSATTYPSKRRIIMQMISLLFFFNYLFLLFPNLFGIKGFVAVVVAVVVAVSVSSMSYTVTHQSKLT
jgi:hypothetical protein